MSRKTMGVLQKLGAKFDENDDDREKDINAEGYAAVENVWPRPYSYDEDEKFIDGLFVAPNLEDDIGSMLGHPSKRYMPRRRSSKGTANC
jgi:hypothetical protein